MKTRFMIEGPENVECTMKITMTLAEWLLLRDDLRAIVNIKYPSYQLYEQIDKLSSHAKKIYYPEDVEDVDV